MTRPIIIAHLIATNFYGGPEKQIISHAQHLDPSRFRFVLISFVENGQPNEIIDKASQLGIDLVELHVDHAFDPRSILRLKNILHDKQVDLLCSHGYKANVLGRLATWINRIPQIAISRGWTGENRKIKIYEVLDKFFLRLNDHIVAVSHGQKDKILKLGIKQKSISVIHNAIDLSLVDYGSRNERLIRRSLGIPDDAIFVASAGRLSPEKNYAGMIEAASQVCAQKNNVYFAVFGEGFLRADLEMKISNLGLDGRFFLPGFNKNMPQVYKEIDVFMLPSFTEGLPNVALEAFAARKPIVATAVGGTPEVVQQGGSGYLTSPDDISGMVQYLLELVSDANMRRHMGETGYAHITKHFSFAEQTMKYVMLYEQLAKRYM
ncbi:MAG: group 1 glycosyl transferase [Geobacter sp.]|nr:MAG: group 1 glycosyl transferase [Geobacter sp.]